MNPQPSAIQGSQARSKSPAITGEECNEFFAWAEMEHSRRTMSVAEAAVLLGIDIPTALKLIDDGTLCASVDVVTGDWLVKTACVRAQLADTVSLATSYGGSENEDELLNHMASSPKLAVVEQNRYGEEVEEHLHGSRVAQDLLDALPVMPGIEFELQPNSQAVPEFIHCDEVVSEMLEHLFRTNSEITALERAIEVPSDKLTTITQETATVEPLAVPSESIQNSPVSAKVADSVDKTLDRAAITAKNIESLMDSLDFANVRLEGSMYRVGYLEAQLSSLELQLELMNEYRNRAAKAILADRENDILKEKIAELETTNNDMHEHLVALDEHLVQAHLAIGRIEQTWWYRLFSWLFNFKPFENLNRG